MTLNQMARKIVKITTAWAKNEGILKEEKKLTEKQLKWEKFLNKWKDYLHKQMWIEFLSETENVDLSFIKHKPVKISFKNFVAVVPLGNDNAHNYKIGQTIVCVEGVSSYCISKDGVQGNHMDPCPKNFRTATLEEVVEFLTVLQGQEKPIDYSYEKLQQRMML